MKNVMNTVRRTLAAIAVAALLCPGLPSQEMRACKAGYKTGSMMTEEEQIFIPAGKKAAAAEIGLSEAGITPSLREGNYIKWINRVVLPDYAVAFYETLEEGISSENNFLIDVEKGEIVNGQYVVPLATLVGTGEVSSDSEEGARSAISEAVKKETGPRRAAMADCAATAYQSFDRDHPEVFWLTGNSLYGATTSFQYLYEGERKYTYSYTQKMYLVLRDPDGNKDVRRDEYVNNPEKILADIEDRDKMIESILSGIPEGASRYEKVKYFNGWLTGITDIIQK